MKKELRLVKTSSDPITYQHGHQTGEANATSGADLRSRAPILSQIETPPRRRSSAALQTHRRWTTTMNPAESRSPPRKRAPTCEGRLESILMSESGDGMHRWHAEIGPSRRRTAPVRQEARPACRPKSKLKLRKRPASVGSRPGVCRKRPAGVGAKNTCDKSFEVYSNATCVTEELSVDAAHAALTDWWTDSAKSGEPYPLNMHIVKVKKPTMSKRGPSGNRMVLLAYCNPSAPWKKNGRCGFADKLEYDPVASSYLIYKRNTHTHIMDEIFPRRCWRRLVEGCG